MGMSEYFGKEGLQMNTDIRILSPCGMLGYRFPEQSFMNGLKYELHGIVVDAGSTDGDRISWAPAYPSSASAR